MNEKQVAESITRQLNRGLRMLEPDVTGRLATARTRALELHRTRGAALELAHAGTARGTGHLGHHGLRAWVALAMVLIILGGVLYWQHRDEVQDIAEIDAALLSGDLPVRAYLDPKFHSWLKRSEQ